MSNRNNKSKSPQKTIDKDLMKYLILQKITKPQGQAELITKTQPDEESEVEDFKQEIETKYRNCRINQTFKFPYENYESSSDNSLQSLQGVTVYNLNCNNLEHLTDATQPHFMKALNERLNRLTDLIVDEHVPLTNKQSILHKVRGHNLSNTSILRPLDQTAVSQGRESVLSKPIAGFRATPTISSEKKNKQIQQLLKITQQKQLNNFYKRTPQINNNYINISTNMNNSALMAAKRNMENIRIKTECDKSIGSVQQYQIVPRSRSKVRESVFKNKKLEISLKTNLGQSQNVGD